MEAENLTQGSRRQPLKNRSIFLYPTLGKQFASPNRMVGRPVRIMRLSLVLIGVWLAAVLVAAHRTDFSPAKTGATAHVERSHEPWKSTTHKLGLRRSSEPVKSLLVSPRIHVFP